MAIDDRHEHNWIIATGDVYAGFAFYGPFENAGVAEDWANRQGFAPKWTLAPLLRPNL